MSWPFQFKVGIEWIYSVKRGHAQARIQGGAGGPVPQKKIKRGEKGKGKKRKRKGERERDT